MVYKKPVGRIPKDFSRETFAESILKDPLNSNSSSNLPNREELQSIIAGRQTDLFGRDFGSSDVTPATIERTQMMFDALRPQQDGGGGFWGDLGGLALKALAVLDTPRSVIASTVQETVDLFQGEGFSGSDWLRQTREHHRFGDIMADLNIDLGLGGWGNRIVGFAGDVAMDPLAWMGGLNAFARQATSRRMSDVLVRRRNDLLNMSGKAAAAEREAVDLAITTLGQTKNMSAVRNVLMKKGRPEHKKLIEDLGIQTGLRLRMPGTGPFLGRISRSSPFVQSASRRRAEKIPQMFKDYAKKEIPEGQTLFDFVLGASKMKGVPKGMKGTDDFVEQVARTVSRVPLEVAFKWPTGSPFLGNFFGRVQALPGYAMGRISVSALGRAASAKFNTEQTNAINYLLRTNDPQRVATGFMMKNTAVRGQTMGANYVGTAERAQEEFLNRIRTTPAFAKIDDTKLNFFTNEIQPVHVEWFDELGREGFEQLDGVSPGYIQRIEAETGVAFEDLIEMRRLYDDLTHGPKGKIREFVVRDDLYGDKSDLAQSMRENDVRGGYTPRAQNEKPVGGYKNARELIKSVFKFDKVSRIPDELMDLLEPEVPFASLKTRSWSEASTRGQSGHFRERTITEPYINSKNEFVPGSELWIPKKGTPDENLFLPNGKRNRDNWVLTVIKRQMPQRLDPEGPAFTQGDLKRGAAQMQRPMAIRYKDHLRPHPENLSVNEQIDRAFRRAGHINDDESLFTQSFARRENGYISSTSRDLKNRAMEVYMANQYKVVFEFSEVAEVNAALEHLEQLGLKAQNYFLKLDDEKKVTLQSIDALSGVRQESSHVWTVSYLNSRIGQSEEILGVLKDEAGEVGDLIRRIVVSKGEVGAAVDEVSEIVNLIEAKMVELGLFNPDVEDLSTSAWRFAEDFDLTKSSQATRRARANFEAVRFLLPLLEKLQPHLEALDTVRNGVAEIRNIVDNLVAVGDQNGATFLTDVADDLMRDLDFLQNGMFPRLSQLAREAMKADRTVESYNFIRSVMNRSGEGVIPGYAYPDISKVLESYSSPTSMQNSLDNVVGEPSSVAGRMGFFFSKVNRNNRKAKTLGQWFDRSGWNLPANKTELDFINKFEGHPFREELVKISEKYFKHLEEGGPAILVRTEEIEEGIFRLDWDLDDWQYGRIMDDLPLKQKESANRIVSEWLNATFMHDIDLSGAVVATSVRRSTRPNVWKLKKGLNPDNPSSWPTVAHVTDDSVENAMMNRWINYGRGGFRIDETGEVMNSTSFIEKGMDLSAPHPSRGRLFNEINIRREPSLPGEVPNSQGGLVKVNRSTGEAAPDVVQTSAVLRFAPDKTKPKIVADYLAQIEEFRHLESILSHEALLAADPNIAPLLTQIQKQIDDLRSIPQYNLDEATAPLYFGRADPRKPVASELAEMFAENPDVSSMRQIIAQGEISVEAPLKDLVNLKTLIDDYDSVGASMGGQKAAIEANNLELKQLVDEARNLYQKISKRRETVRRYQRALTVRERQIQEKLEVIESIELRHAYASMREQKRIADMQVQRLKAEEILGKSPKGDKFGINYANGDVDFSKITSEDLRKLWQDSARTWGYWRVAGDEQFHDDITLVLLATQKLNDRKQVEGFLKTYDKVHNWMKAQMVATPGFVNRNVFGAMFNMWMDDLPLSEVPLAFINRWRALKAGDGDAALGFRILAEENPNDLRLQLSSEITNIGAASGGQAASSVERNLLVRRRFEFLFGTKGGLEKGTRVNVNPADAGFFLYSSVRHANTHAEEALRLAAGVGEMLRGGNLNDSADTIFRVHFNYADLSNFEEEAMKRIFPFYTWVRKNLPLQVEQLLRNPKRYNRLLSIKENLEYGEEKEDVVPDYFMKPFGIQLPFSIGGSTTYTVPDIPFQDLLRFDPTQEGFDDVLGNVLSSMSPVLKVPLEYNAGKQFFKDIPYTGRYQQVPVAWDAIPGLMPALGAINWAEQNSKGEWKMMDSRIAVLDNFMPFIGRLRRVIPNETRYQERYIQTLVSTLGGINIRINTPFEQHQERVREDIRRSLLYGETRDIERRQR